MAATKVVESYSGLVKRIPVYIPAEVNEAITRHSREAGKSVQVVIREGIESFCASGGNAQIERRKRGALGEDACQLTLRLEPLLADRFTAKCKEQGVSKSAVIRQVVDDILADSSAS